MEYEKIRVSTWFRAALIALDVIALACVGYGKSYSGHTSGTVIDQAFLETVRQIVVHERFAIFGTIAAICFLLTTLLVFLPDFTEIHLAKAKWAAIISGIFGLCIFGYLLTDVVPILQKPLTVSYENAITEEKQSERNDKTPLVNSSDGMVREMEQETVGPEQPTPYYMVYCNGKILRMYDIHQYTLGEDVK